MNLKSVEKKEKNTAELTVEITAEEFDTAVNKAYAKSRGSIAIPGFRKGKAPRRIIEKMYGENIFYDDALDAVIPEAYTFATADGDLKVAARPSVKDMKVNDDKSVTVVFSVALMPEITLGEYKGLKAVKPAAEVTEEAVMAEVDRLRQRNARIEDVERPAKLGDTANIDYVGSVDGVEFEGGKGTAHDLELGSGSFIPGFEEQVVGMSAGEERDVNVTFPQEYHAENLAGKAAVFHVKCNAVKEKILPELDDEFAKDVSEFDTLEEFKADVRKKQEETKAKEAEDAFKSNAIDAALNGVEWEIPDAMIEERLDSAVDSYKSRIKQQGIEFDLYLKLMGTDEAGFRSQMRPGAEKELKKELLYAKIAEAENFEITDEEKEAEYERIASEYNMKAEDVKKYISADSILEQLRFEKAEKLITESAVAE